jgi:hypothetical protein
VDPTNNNIVVGGLDCLKIFNASGAAVTSYCSPGTGLGQFVSIFGVTVDQSGNIYVVDNGSNRVEVFNSALSCTGQWGGTGSGLGQFDDPFGIVLDNGGSAGASLYVVDNGNARIEKFTLSGTPVAQWPVALATPDPTNGVTEAINAIATDPSNNVYLSKFPNSKIYKLDPNGSPITQWVAPEMVAVNEPNPEYRGLAIDASGNIDIAYGQLNYNGIRKMDSSGNVIGDRTTLATPSSKMGQPFAIAINQTSGLIYVVDFLGLTPGIYVFSP